MDGGATSGNDTDAEKEVVKNSVALLLYSDFERCVGLAV